MKNVTLLTSLLLFSSMGANASDVETRIINGSDTSSASYPSIASLVYESNGYFTVYCGATILDNYHVLTAAHCIFGDDDAVNNTYVAPQLDNKNQYANDTIHKVKATNIYYPDSYRDSSVLAWPNDIAIVEVSQSLQVSSSEFVSLGQTTQQDEYTETSLNHLAVGHGYTDNDYSDKDQLQVTTLYVVEGCDIAFENGFRICTSGYESSGSSLLNSTCQGDSGGPLYWDNNGEIIQIGITSFGPTECGVEYKDGNVEFTSVFTEVAAYNDWIDDVLAGRESPKIIVGSDPFNFGPSSGSMGVGGLLMVLALAGTRRIKR
ncbi:trypsin-like serine protease [Vibrio sp. qd031]|uniref:S1 family peptidase n=1 Tax=Vibrio sp. qd031 TaxID=1603038 RepID=UPI000A118537|nr:trypsin-like serine protease [Vibrio sp. qd031]